MRIVSPTEIRLRVCYMCGVELPQIAQRAYPTETRTTCHVGSAYFRLQRCAASHQLGIGKQQAPCKFHMFAWS